MRLPLETSRRLQCRTTEAVTASMLKRTFVRQFNLVVVLGEALHVATAFLFMYFRKCTCYFPSFASHPPVPFGNGVPVILSITGQTCRRYTEGGSSLKFRFLFLLIQRSSVGGVCQTASERVCKILVKTTWNINVAFPAFGMWLNVSRRRLWYFATTLAPTPPAKHTARSPGFHPHSEHSAVKCMEFALDIGYAPSTSNASRRFPFIY